MQYDKGLLDGTECLSKQQLHFFFFNEDRTQ
jgi:hypothetical protein